MDYTFKVTDYYNNGYNGGITVQITTGTVTKTYDIGPDDVAYNPQHGYTLFGMTTDDEEFINYDTDADRNYYVELGWIEPERDEWDDDILTDLGEQARKDAHLDMLNLALDDEEDGIVQHIATLAAKQIKEVKLDKLTEFYNKHIPDQLDVSYEDENGDNRPSDECVFFAKMLKKLLDRDGVELEDVTRYAETNAHQDYMVELVLEIL